MRRKSPVHLDEHLRLVFRHRMDRVNNVERFAVLFSRQFQIAVTERIELESAIAFVHHLLRGGGK